MKRAIIELLWLIGILTIATIICLFRFSNSATDINMHDTYFLEDGRVQHPTVTLIVFIYFVLFGFVISQTRVLFFGLKIIETNIVLIAFAGLCLYFLGDVWYVLHPQSHFERLPRLSGVTTTPSFNRYSSTTHNWLPATIKMYLITVLTFTSFMTGRSFKISADK